MTFVLKSSGGILKDGEQFNVSASSSPQPPPDDEESESSRSPNPDPPVDSNTGDDDDERPESPEDVSSSTRDLETESSLDPGITVKTEGDDEDVPILSAYTLNEEALSGSVTSPDDSSNSNTSSIFTTAPTQERLYEERGRRARSPSIAVESENVPPSARTRPTLPPPQSSAPPHKKIRFERIDTSVVEDVKEVFLKIPKQYDPKMGTFYSCPRCYQKYVTSECVKEHLEKNCKKERISQFRLLQEQQESGGGGGGGGDDDDEDDNDRNTELNAVETIIDSGSSDDMDDDPDYIQEQEDYQPRKPFNYQCRFCSARFQGKLGLTNHERIRHGRNTSFPNSPVKNKKLLDEEPVTCPLCQVVLSARRSLRRHLQTVHELENPRVNSIMDNIPLVLRSQSPNSAEGAQPPSSTPTPASSATSSSSSTAAPIFTPPTFSYCSLCNDKFITQEDLKRHMDKHTKEMQERIEAEKPYSCSYCDKTFFLKTYLDDHEKIHTAENEYPHSCSVCGEYFKMKMELIQHCLDNDNCSLGATADS